MPSDAHDVAVIGAGLAGLASSMFLRKAGLSVVCLDTDPYPHRKVGESLDWSSPALLARLGIDTASLIAGGIATWKKKITVCELRDAAWAAAPPESIRRSPLRFETITLHVDRTALDLRIFELARSLGTTFLWERVTDLEWDGDRVRACTTAAGRRVRATWFVDATGTARLFSRTMRIPVTTYGRPKVCLWTYFDTPPLDAGTTFFADNRSEYLEWVWDIPISPVQTSVGLVLAADTLRDRRRAGRSIEGILRDELARYPRFRELLERTPSLAVERTSFQPYVVATVCGVNWLMAGEAASMPDPLTGNGVTSGIRHARHAADAIRQARGSDELSRRTQRMYTRHVLRLGQSFNAHIERVIYRAPVRRLFGLRTATYVYTFFAFFINALHARFDPRGGAGMAVFALLFAAARGWIAGWVMVARAMSWRVGRA